MQVMWLIQSLKWICSSLRNQCNQLKLGLMIQWTWILKYGYQGTLVNDKESSLEKALQPLTLAYVILVTSLSLPLFFSYLILLFFWSEELTCEKCETRS